MSRKYVARRVLTKEPLGEIPLISDGAEHELSGPGSLTGTVSPDVGALRGEDGRLVLEEWGTEIYEEVDGEIRWGGLVISAGWQGSQWTIECAGFSTYPVGTPWTGELTSTGIDPIDVIKAIWAEIQRQPDSDLGMIVTGASSSGTRVGTTEEPYELLWWNTPDCGREIETLAAEGPLDFTERHTWVGDDIRHELVIGYPRLGRRREDLTFVQGVNIAVTLNPGVSGDDFANQIIGIGAGEGKGGVRRTTAIPDGRLRRTKVVSRKDVTQTDRLDALIRDELQRCQATMSIDSVTVVDHANAEFGSWDLGDDILIQGTIPWLGDIAIWHRIVGWAPTGTTRATLKLARSDSFTYGG